MAMGAGPSSSGKSKSSAQRTRGRSPSPAANQRSPAGGSAAKAGGSSKKAKVGSGVKGRKGDCGEEEEEEDQSGSGSEDGSEEMSATGKDSDGSGDDASDTSPPSMTHSSGIDGSTTIPLPGASDKEWRSNDFSILVCSSWRKEKGFRLFEVDTSETKFPPEDTVQGCTLPAREWYCAKEVAPKAGFLPGQHGFLPKTKGFAPTRFAARSWLQVAAMQMSRYKVSHAYSDSDEGILTLPADETVTLLAAEANGWSLLRTDSGLEGWFPSSYVQPVR
eukprot:CAMPEP_0180237564 /NCGR_PEP_ID=MMETSP0987-20121128/30435_1 /TAXON_ID=697907 /ORGANISM="non described non described, Strain CCMP2293" /LENGTH=275 /DNA_ID=CAMNT_0022203975 /DNA_START=44 /DNA_END=867 /DNA_ORIENTATION=+